MADVGNLHSIKRDLKSFNFFCRSVTCRFQSAAAPRPGTVNASDEDTPVTIVCGYCTYSSLSLALHGANAAKLSYVSTASAAPRSICIYLFLDSIYSTVRAPRGTV